MLPEGIPLKVLIKRRLSHGCALILDFLPFHQAGRFQTCRLNPHTHTYTWMFAHTYGFIMIYQCLSYVFQLRRDLWFRARGWRMLWKSQLRRFGPGSPDRSQLNHQKWESTSGLTNRNGHLADKGTSSQEHNCDLPNLPSSYYLLPIDWDLPSSYYLLLYTRLTLRIKRLERSIFQPPTHGRIYVGRMVICFISPGKCLQR